MIIDSAKVARLRDELREARERIAALEILANQRLEHWAMVRNEAAGYREALEWYANMNQSVYGVLKPANVSLRARQALNHAALNAQADDMHCDGKETP